MIIVYTFTNTQRVLEDLVMLNNRMYPFIILSCDRSSPILKHGSDCCVVVVFHCFAQLVMGKRTCLLILSLHSPWPLGALSYSVVNDSTRHPKANTAFWNFLGLPLCLRGFGLQGISILLSLVDCRHRHLKTFHPVLEALPILLWWL